MEGQMTARSQPMGFWTYPTKGHPKRSTQILLDLKAKQTPQQINPKGPVPDADAASLATHYSKENLPGAAAWIDGDYKLLKSIPKKGAPKFALYHLSHDKAEKQDLSQKDPERFNKMKASLQGWQESVVDSLNGKDYVD